MKRKIAVILAIVVVIAVAFYLAFPGLMVKWTRDRDRKAAGLEEKSLRIKDHEIVYLEGGKGAPILLVHGFGANKDHWTKFSKFITPAYHVVAPDLPGFGNSTYLNNASYGIVDQAKRLDQFVNALGLKKFHIVGNSMGGQISARYAIMFPQKVLSLGLFDSLGVKSPTPSDLYKKLTKGEKNPLIVSSVEDLDGLMRFAFFTPPKIPGFAMKVLAQEAISHKASNAKIFKDISGTALALEPDLPKIKARTLVIWGDHDRLLHISSVQVLERGLPNCTKVIMKDCGHVPMMERPKETAGHYMTFLKNK